MNWIIKILMLSLLCFSTACFAASPTNLPPTPAVVTLAPPATSSTSVPTSLPSDEELLAVYPHCDGMQIQKDRIKFDWPNLEEHMEEFSGSVWLYYTCEQPQLEVSTLYREELLKPPFNLQEVNWFDREEGTLGVYFSQRGSWHYVWIIPQPNTARKSYVIVAESFAYIEC